MLQEAGVNKCWVSKRPLLRCYGPDSFWILSWVLSGAGSNSCYRREAIPWWGCSSFFAFSLVFCLFLFLLISHHHNMQSFISGPALKETKMASVGSQNWAVIFSEAASGVTSCPVCLWEQPSRDPQVCVARVQLFYRETPFLLSGQTWRVFWQRTAIVSPNQEYLYLHHSCLHALACLWNLFLLLHN